MKPPRSVLLSSALALGPCAAPLLAQIPDQTAGFLDFPIAQVGGEIRGIAVSPSGLLYTVDATDRIIETDPVTGAQQTVMSGLPISAGAMLRFGDGRPLTGTDLLLVDWNTEETAPCCGGRVLRIDPATGAYSVIVTANPTVSGNADPYGIALGPGGAFGDDIYVTDYQGFSTITPSLFRVDSNGVATQFVSDPQQWTHTAEPQYVEFGPASFGGDLFVTDRVSQTLWRIDAAGALSPFVTGHPFLAVATPNASVWGDYLYLLVQSAGTTDLYRVDPAGNLEVVVAGIPASVPRAGLVFRPDGKLLYLGVGNRVYVVVPASLQLAAAPNPAFVGQTVQISAAGGVAGQPVVLVSDRVLTYAFSPPAVLAFGGMDATGQWTLQQPVTTILAGLDVRLQAVSLDAAGDFNTTPKLWVQFQ